MFYTKSIQLQVFLFKNCFILFCLRGFCVIWVCGVFWGKYLILSTFPLNYPYVGQCLSLNTLAVKLLRSSELLFLSSWYSFFLGLTNLGSKDIKSNLFQIAYQSINHRTQYHCVIDEEITSVVEDLPISLKLLRTITFFFGLILCRFPHNVQLNSKAHIRMLLST